MAKKKLFLQIIISTFVAYSFILQAHAQIYQSLEHVDVKWYPLLDPDSISCIQESVMEISMEDKENAALFFKNEQGETFFDLLFKLIAKKGLTGYQSTSDDRFAYIMAFKEIEENLDEDINTFELNIENVKSYEILKYDFYDLEKNLILSRTIVIAPIFHKSNGDKQIVCNLSFYELAPLIVDYSIVDVKGKSLSIIDFFEKNKFHGIQIERKSITIDELVCCDFFKHEPNRRITVIKKPDIDPKTIAYGKLIEKRIVLSHPSNKILLMKSIWGSLFNLLYWGYYWAGLNEYFYTLKEDYTISTDSIARRAIQRYYLDIDTKTIIQY